VPVFHHANDNKAILAIVLAAVELLGIVGAELLPVLHVPAVFTNGGVMPTWACPLLVSNRELGRELADSLGSAGLCHLQGHGIVSVADSMQRATVTAIALEQLAEANLAILGTAWLILLIVVSHPARVLIPVALLVFAVQGALLIGEQGLNLLTLSQLGAAGYIIAGVLIALAALRWPPPVSEIRKRARFFKL